MKMYPEGFINMTIRGNKVKITKWPPLFDSCFSSTIKSEFEYACSFQEINGIPKRNFYLFWANKMYSMLPSIRTLQSRNVVTFLP